MYKTLWTSLLLSPAILGAAWLGSASASATETLTVTQEAKPQTAEIQIPEVRQDASSVSTTPMVATVSATKVNGEAVADIEAAAPTIRSDRSPVVANLFQAPTSVSIMSPEAPTADSSSTSAPGLVAEVHMQTSDASVLEQINQYSNESDDNTVDQVTNVTQLRDVSPGDWAFEALRSLVERYGCIAGYPDGSYRGNRAMSRYEFAAGLN